MKSLNINLLTTRLIIAAALLINSASSMAGTVGIWNDTDDNLKVTVTKANGKKSLSQETIAAHKTLEMQDPITGSTFQKIVVYKDGKEVNSWNLGKKEKQEVLDIANGPDIAFRIFKEGDKYYTSRPHKTLSDLKEKEAQKLAAIKEEERVAQFKKLSPEELRDNLWFAAKINNMQEFRELIRAGADINTRYNASSGKGGYYTEWTYLIIVAAEYKKLELVQELIKAKANVNVKDNTNSTALMRAARNHDLKIVQELIKAKADVNAKDNSGTNPLMWALEGYGDPTPIVQELIKAKADVKEYVNVARGGAVGQLGTALDYAKQRKTESADAQLHTPGNEKIWQNIIDILIKAGAQ